MTPATTSKSLVSIIVFLLITNIVMLVFFLVLNKPVQKNPHRDQNGMAGMLQKEVGFTKDQLDIYQSLRKGRVDSVHILFDDIRNAKMNFYTLIYADHVPDSVINKTADVIAEKQKSLDLHMFNHFKMVRNICTPDQLQKFDSTIKKAFVRMTGKPRP